MIKRTIKLALTAALLALAPTPLAGCAGAAPGPFEDTEDLRAFLKTEAPVPEELAELERLNETFARQSVRAHGYLREGVGDATEDGWSPVVRAGSGDATAADISPWLEAGDIDAAGQFVPTAELCDAIGPVPTEGLAEAELRLEGLQDRLTRLSCALERLAGGETSITWSEPSAAALSLTDSGGAALVNPRVLHLIFPEGMAAPPSEPELEPASAEPEDDEIQIDEADINEHHPRPPPDPDDGSTTSSEDVAECIDSCAKGCDLLVTILDACDDSEAMSEDSSGDCESSVPGQRAGSLQAFLFSIGLVFALVLRRIQTQKPKRARIQRQIQRQIQKTRGRGARSSSLLLIPLFLALLHGGSGRAQPAPAAAPPPPEVEGAAPPLPPKDWKKLHQEGLKKLDEKNYGDAIRLLREAYLLDPTVDKLEAIARAQKAAGQTPQAIQTLEHARVQFGQAMTEEKYNAITAQIEKMKTELVKVRVIVTPIDAKISIDGDEMPSGAAGTPIDIAPGTHKFGASAEGYAAGYRTVEIKTEPATQDVVLKLPATKFYLVITAPDPEFAIEIDDVEMGRGAWSGFVEPGAHRVALKHPDGRIFNLPVSGAAGEAMKLPNRAERIAYPGMPEPADEPPPERTPDSIDEPGGWTPDEHEFRETGYYFLANASILWNTSRPYGFEDLNPVPGVAVGGRAGYRPYSALAFELHAEYAYFGVEDELTQQFGSFTDRSNAAYTIEDVRFGVLARIMSTHPQNRLLFAVGGGVLYEWINLSHADIVFNAALNTYKNVGTYKHRYSGFGGFLGLETGYERSVGRLLLGAVFNLFLDNISSIEGTPYDASFNVRLGGSFRIGYSAFTLEQLPKKKR